MNPETGYSGRRFKIRKGGVIIAAVQTKEAAHNAEPIDVTNDDSEGYRRLLSERAVRSIDVSIEGVATIANYYRWIADWANDTYEDVALEHPDGTVETAEDGFILTSLAITGEHNGNIAFSAELQSSGPITITPTPSTT